MQLTNEQIRSVTLGATEIEFEDGFAFFHRMHRAQAQRISAPGFEKIGDASAGVRLDFYTDSEYFGFSYAIEVATAVNFYNFTLYIDGKEYALIGENPEKNYCGEYQTRLPQGKKRVTLFFPYTVTAKLKNITLSDGASISPFVPKRRFVFHGDSITFGHNAQSPANSYANQIAYAFDAEIFNFAVGGAKFDVSMIDETSNYNADAVFVAFGTNDWGRPSMQEFSVHCEAFFQKLALLHKDVPVFVILPIWRFDCATKRPVGSFQDVKDEISRIAKEVVHAQILDLADDIPQDLSLFTDGLHPNDAGFAYYTKGVLNKIKL